MIDLNEAAKTVLSLLENQTKRTIDDARFEISVLKHEIASHKKRMGESKRMLAMVRRMFRESQEPVKLPRFRHVKNPVTVPASNTRPISG